MVRRFLVDRDLFSTLMFTKSWNIVQNILAYYPLVVIRTSDIGTATIVMERIDYPVGIDETEVPISPDAAYELMALCHGRPLKLHRFIAPVAETTWIIDQYVGYGLDLLLASTDKAYEEAEVLPQWVTKEVTFDLRYSLRYLFMRPSNDTTQKGVFNGSP